MIAFSGASEPRCDHPERSEVEAFRRRSTPSLSSVAQGRLATEPPAEILSAAKELVPKLLAD